MKNLLICLSKFAQGSSQVHLFRLGPDFSGIEDAEVSSHTGDLLKIFKILSLFIALWTFETASAYSCRALFSSKFSKLPAPLQQLLLWEQTSNQARWTKPTTPIYMETAQVDRSRVEIRHNQLSKLLAHDLMPDSTMVVWPHHPLNSSPTPFKEMETNGFMEVQYSASRSMFNMVGDEFYSIKVPTDRPHPQSEAQPSKATLVNDVIISMRRSRHIYLTDLILGPSAHLKVLTETLSVADKKSGNGFLVRDLRPLNDGNYYLPAFSIPYAGREIANKIGQNFESLWEEAYGANLGRAKALYLLRYGLQMKTPNAQNWLIQLDPQFRPTGKIYLRDVPDSSYIDFVANKIGSAHWVNHDVKSDYTILKHLHPYWSNSAWQMDEGGVKVDVLHRWGQVHDRSYIETIKSELGVNKEIQTIDDLQTFLTSPEGQRALENYARQRRLISLSTDDRNTFATQLENKNYGSLLVIEVSFAEKIKKNLCRTFNQRQSAS